MFIEKVANSLIGGGILTSVTSAMTRDDWQVVGILSGIAIGLLGVAVKAMIDWHFKSEHLKLAQSRAAALGVIGDDL
jgi:cytochrome c biogenesis protein CcdA